MSLLRVLRGAVGASGVGRTAERSLTRERSTLEGVVGLGILDGTYSVRGSVHGNLLGKGGGILQASGGKRKALDLVKSCSEVANLLERGLMCNKGSSWVGVMICDGIGVA